MNNTSLKDIPFADELRGIDRVFDPASAALKPRNKVISSLEEAVRLSGLRDGMTISFHHHFRNGDYIVGDVVDTLAGMGFKNLVLAASSLTDCHYPLIEHIKNGVIRRIETSGLRGKLADAVSHGLMEVPVVFRSHGGRAGAIDTGVIDIGVAFLGAPSCDPAGNANGYARDTDGGIMCGSMGYAKCDAARAKKTIIITNKIVDYPNAPFAISEHEVDYIVETSRIGDSAGIMTGATRFTKNPKELLMAELACNVIAASGRFKDGFSFQTGTGGASLAVTRFLRDLMLAQDIKARFALGGITGSIVELHEEGLIKRLIDVQGFDLKAAESLRDNRFHQQISASFYASPFNPGAAVNQLDVVVLSALEADCGFNVNVLTGSDGVIRGAIGGHPDTAYGAAVSIVVLPLTRGRIPCVVKKVETNVTPGETVDVIVTDHGVAVNPRRADLAERFAASGLPLQTIEALQKKAESIVGDPDPIEYLDRIVGVVTYRDGSVMDVVRQVKD
ncbi:MAG: citrate lyase subunit alpha [Clostridiales bacterium]|jgi:citrate lyase subunit alpha/citrate CoA-transferase|nr:citrate lyase subunit alpha [Clostridiales bacterium]